MIARNVFKKVIMMLWIALVGAVVFALLNQDNFFKRDVENVAILQTKSGDVLFREEGLVRWRETVEKQKLFDGDWVATGQNGLTDIEFRSGQVIKLGADTQVQIRSIIQQNNDYSFMITLSRGAVVAHVKNEIRPKSERRGIARFTDFLGKKVSNGQEKLEEDLNSPALVVRSGNSSFNIVSGKSLGLVKDPESKELKKINVKAAYESKLLTGRLRISTAETLNYQFLPPSSLVFPEKKGSVFVTKEAALMKGSHETLVEKSGSSDFNDKIAALSASLFSGEVTKSQGRSILPAELSSSGLSPKFTGLPALNLSAKKSIKDNQSDTNKVLTKRIENRSPTEQKVVQKALKADGFEYAVKMDNNRQILFTDRSSSNFASEVLEIPLTAPKEFPKGELWRPILEVVGRGTAKIPLIEGHNSADLALKLPVSLMAKFGRVRINEGVKEYEVSVRAGIAIIGQSGRTESFEKRYSTIVIRTYGEIPPRSTTIGLDRLQILEHADSPWISPKKEIVPYQAPLWISLEYGRDIPMLLPYIAAASEVGVTSQGPREDVGLFVVKNQQVIGEIGGSAVTSSLMRSVLEILDAEFIFRGKKSSLHNPRSHSQGDLATWVDSALDKGKVLYVMKRSKVYPVSREFIKTNTEVSRFIDSQAKAVFVDKVDVMQFRR